jgi:hypothetical protein
VKLSVAGAVVALMLLVAARHRRIVVVICIVELIEQFQQRPHERLVREERLRLVRPQQRLVQNQLLVSKQVCVVGVDRHPRRGQHVREDVL